MCLKPYMVKLDVGDDEPLPHILMAQDATDAATSLTGYLEECWRDASVVAAYPLDPKAFADFMKVLRRPLYDPRKARRSPRRAGKK